MTLRTIVAAFGGDLYAGGARASIPAPGHSAADRSVSLLLNGDRLVIHGFGGADWREVRDLLRGRGFIDHDGRLTGAPRSPQAPPRLDCRQREAAATRLWAGVVVAKGDDDLPPHNALRFCHGAPEVNGCAVPLREGQAALRSGDCRGPRRGQNRGRCARGARQSQGVFQ